MSTMLEAFDTQMVDFQTDPDYSMQLSSSDPWFQEEATMEADGHSPLQTTIEVEMEPYDEHHQPEYEMEDDLGTFEAAPNDIHDVEVYDASRFQSPDIPHDGSPIVDSTQPPPIVTEDSEPSNHVLSSSEPQKLDDFTSPVHYHRSPSPHQPEASISSTTEEPTLPAETILQAEDHVESAGLTVTNDFHDSSSDVAEELRTERQLEAEDPEESTLEGDNSEAVEVHADLEPSGDEVNQNVEEYAVPPEFEDSTSDPHEISEGVYIDPPPPVLISLSADEPSISLFNIPSKSCLDSHLQNESDAPELVVLLSQLPTLYYEPLSSVFEALRQEEYLSGIPGLLSGELLLDAYDLELIMSEDYTYAHELSLHDLNVLHDGLHKSGPLRLRLRTVTPRFIDRYHLLQDQIAQSQTMGPTFEREISSANPTTEENSDTDHATGAEAFVKESTAQAVATFVDPSTQAKALSADLVTEAEAPDTEAYQHEGGGDDGPALPENLEDQQDDHKAEQEIEASENRYDHKADQETEALENEEEYISEESTAAPIVETNSADGITKCDLPGSQTDKDVHDDDNDHEKNGGLDSHADDPQQQNEFEEANNEDASTTLIDERHPDFGVESEILEHTSHNVLFSTQEKDVGDIDAQHLDETESNEDDEEPGSVIINPGERAVEFDSTTEENEELIQANSLVDEDPLKYEAAEHVVDVPDDNWNDSLDGDGDWEAEEDDDNQGHDHEQSYDHEHGHDHDTVSNSSSVTLSSKSSFKRSLSEAELEEYVEDDFSPSLPDPKKARVE